MTIIIICIRYGGVEAALFVLLTTLNKQLEFEQSADIYMFAKLLYMKRPGVFRSKVIKNIINHIPFTFNIAIVIKEKKNCLILGGLRPTLSMS